MLKISVRVYLGLLGRLPLVSREYAVLKISIIESPPPGNYNVEILCEPEDAKLLLDHAQYFYSEAVPYIEHALGSIKSHQ